MSRLHNLLANHQISRARNLLVSHLGLLLSHLLSPQESLVASLALIQVVSHLLFRLGNLGRSRHRDPRLSQVLRRLGAHQASRVVSRL